MISAMAYKFKSPILSLFYLPNRPYLQFPTLSVVQIVVQSLSYVRLFASPWTAAHQASLFITISWSFLKLMSIKFVIPHNHLVLCYPLLLLPSIFPSIRIFSDEFTFLPGLLRPSQEGALHLHPIKRAPEASVNRASPMQGLYWLSV